MSMLAPHSPLRRSLSYRKFAGHKTTVLILDSGYHLQTECATALTRLGHRAVSLKVGELAGVHDTGTAMRQLLTMLLEVRPDLVLSINQIGFDAEGSIGSVLQDCGIPVAVWYVDCPFLLYDGHLHTLPPRANVFLWERQYIATLQACGVSNVHYLPLACDPSRFAPCAQGTPTLPVGFVGSSMRFAEAKWHGMLDGPEQKEGDHWAHALLADRARLITFLSTPKPPPDRRMLTLAYATWAATGWYRQRLLRSLLEADLPLHVFGDEGWQHLLPAAKLHGAVRYGPDLAAVYRQCVCSFNATSMQMPTAVNQRVFDVFAAGGLLLTDAQQDVRELFGDVIYPIYSGPEELVDLARFYQRHTTARQQCIDAVRAAILHQHTYEHRLADLLHTVRSQSA